MNRRAGALSWRLVRVWRRDWLVNLHSWHVSFVVPLLEPVLYVAAFGVGFRLLIPAVQYQGQTVSYVMFMAPALLATSIMYNAFFENTYASFIRMYYQKTYDAIMATPLSIEEVIAGEMVWGATKSLMAAAIVLTVLSAFGLVRYPDGLAVIPLALLGGLGFGALAMVFTGLVKNIDMFNLPVFLCLTPMFLFSGTFFPIDTLPRWAQMVAWTLPLTHLVALARAMTFGMLSLHDVLVSGGYLLGFTALFFPLALAAMRRRLIK
jgi:lipooligosaccharide transport system permease protein